MVIIQRGSAHYAIDKLENAWNIRDDMSSLCYISADSDGTRLGKTQFESNSSWKHLIGLLKTKKDLCGHDPIRTDIFLGRA